MTFGALFRTVATAAGAPAGRRAVPGPAPAGDRGRGRGAPRRPRPAAPLRRAARLRRAPSSACSTSCRRPGSSRGRSRRAPATLEGSAYLSDIATLFAGYAEARERLRPGRLPRDRPRGDRAAAPRRRLLGRPPGLPLRARRPHPQPVRAGRGAGGADRGDRRAPLRGGQRRAGRPGARCSASCASGSASPRRPGPSRRRSNTESDLLFHLARGFGAAGRRRRSRPARACSCCARPASGARPRRSPTEVSRLVARRRRPGRDRDRPARPGAARPGDRRGAGGQRHRHRARGRAAGRRDRGRRRPDRAARGRVRRPARAGDLLRYLRGPSGFSPGRVDWLERALRRGRVQDAETALELWQGEEGEPPRDLVRLREAAARSPAALAGEVGQARRDDGVAAPARRRRRAGARPRRRARAAGGRGDRRRARRAGRARRAWRPARRSWRRRSRGSTSASGAARSRDGCGSPAPTGCAPAASTTSSSPRCRTASSRAATAAATPSSPKRSAATLGLDPRRDSDAEERYLFYVCLSLPRRRLFLSYRDSDENGGAEARSPLLDDVRALLAPPPDGAAPDPVEEAITRSRDLARVVHPLAEAPSEDELARALAAHGTERRPGGPARRGRRRRRALRGADRRQDRGRARGRGGLARARAR